MTKRELIFNIFEKLKIESDDMDITQEYVSYLIDAKRAMLLKQRFDAKPWAMPLETKQEICVDLELTDNVAGYPCFGKILRSKNPMPSSIKIKGKEGPLTIRLFDRTAIHVNVVPLERLPYIGHNRFTKQMIYGAIDYDNRIYLISESGKHAMLEHIRVGDIWENPDEAHDLLCSNDGGEDCDVWDRDYPIEMSMVDDLAKMVIDDLKRSINVPEDKINDSDGERKTS